MYPTRRMIFLVLLGAPLSPGGGDRLAALWMIGVVWIVFAAALYLLDIVLAASPSALTLNLRLPATLGVARAQDGFVNLAFAGAGAAEVELAIRQRRACRRLAGAAGVYVARWQAEARFALTPLRRGEGEVGPLWARWRGPLGLCWRQRLEEKGGTVPIVPNIATVKEEAVRCSAASRAATVCARNAQRRGARSSTRSRNSRPGWTGAPSTGSRPRATANCSPANSRRRRTSISSSRSIPGG